MTTERISSKQHEETPVTKTERPSHGRSAWRSFVGWYRKRPFIGGALTVLAGIEIFFSGQLDLGHIHVQVGIEGLQATIIPILLVVLGVLSTAMPVHRVFYGVIALVISVYSLIGVNLGGFVVGMLLGAVGSIIVIAWMPKVTPTPSDATLVIENSAPEPPPFGERRQ